MHSLHCQLSLAIDRVMLIKVMKKTLNLMKMKSICKVEKSNTEIKL